MRIWINCFDRHLSWIPCEMLMCNGTFFLQLCTRLKTMWNIVSHFLIMYSDLLRWGNKLLNNISHIGGLWSLYWLKLFPTYLALQFLSFKLKLIFTFVSMFLSTFSYRILTRNVSTMSAWLIDDEKSICTLVLPLG